jgi:hypothetical protein
LNEGQVVNFITWFLKLPIKHKVFVAGNHDVSIERGYIDKELFSLNNIVYLENSECTFQKTDIVKMSREDGFGETNWEELFICLRNIVLENCKGE